MLLIILPIRNETKTVIETLKKIKPYLSKDCEALFIDDGSKDGTFEKLWLCNHPRVRVIRNNFDNGKGSAIKTGIILSEYLYKLNADDMVGLMDGDGQIDPAEIKTFLKLIELYSADAAIGNKRHIFSTTKYTPIRNIVSKTYNFLCRKMFDINFEDTQCGLKIFKKKCLDEVISKVTSKRYAFDLELIVALKEKHYRIVDVPVSIKRQMNQGSVSLKSIVHTLIDTLGIYFRKVKGYYV